MRPIMTAGLLVSAGRWSTLREQAVWASEKGTIVPASRAGSDAWLARRLGVWARLAGRIRKVER